jgi:hypothetical protein
MKLDYEIINEYKTKIETKKSLHKCKQYNLIKKHFLNEKAFEWGKSAVSPYLYLGVDLERNRIILNNWGIAWKELNDPYLDYRLHVSDDCLVELTLIQLWDRLFLLNPTLEIDMNESITFAMFERINKRKYKYNQNLYQLKKTPLSLFDDDYNSRRGFGLAR